MDLLQRTALFMRQNAHVPPGTRLLLAVSGGNDSLVLLHVFSQLRETLDLQLHVASLDHGLRGAAGAADAQFVREQCELLGVEVTLGAARGLQGEADARRARYDFLAETALQTAARHVLTAHHADDQAETVLLNLLRGCGLRGLAGMQAVSPLPGHPRLALLRPFLKEMRSGLQAWCRSHGLQPRQDASNNDRRLRRNRLRHEVIPALRDFNPRVEQALQRLSGSVALDHEFIQQQLALATGDDLRFDCQAARLSRAGFNALHPALQHHFVLMVLRRLGAAETGSDHVERVVALAREGVTGQRHSLPGLLQLRLDYEDLVIEHSGAMAEWHGPLLFSSDPVPVKLPGETPLPRSPWSLFVGQGCSGDDRPNVCLSLPPAAGVTLDVRRPGDSFEPPGLPGHSRTLKKWMIDQRLPRGIRMQIPLLRVDGRIAAIFTGREAVPAAGFRASPGAANAMTVAIRRAPG